MPVHAPEVEEVVRSWLSAQQTPTADDRARAMGAEADDWWADAAGVAAAHTGGQPFSAVFDDVEAHREDTIAWAAARGRIVTGEGAGLPVHLTLVLELRDGEWLVIQSHVSVPDD